MLALCTLSAPKLDLSNCGLTSLPEEVVQHGSHLQQLKLAGNQLEALPTGITALTGLNTLVLDNNLLPELPQVRRALVQRKWGMYCCRRQDTRL